MATRRVGKPPPVPARPIRLYIAPANYAGQGNAWSRAVERDLPGVGAVCMATVRAGGFRFPADEVVPEDVYALSRMWQRRRQAYLELFTHVVIEAERPLVGGAWGTAFDEARRLRDAGRQVAMLCHGSDIRLPSRHLAATPWSPFSDPDWPLVAVLEEQARRNQRGLEEAGLPVFVSTPDLLLDLPWARWVPVTVDVATWVSDIPVLERRRPVVVHAPSSSRLKGSERIEPILSALDAKGAIEYRRLQHVPAEAMPSVYGDADIVLDQFVLGIYGVAACEAMAAGRLVISHVTQQVRASAKDRGGLEMPVVEATLENLGEVLERVLHDRDWAREAAQAGPAFVNRLHDGREASATFAGFLGVDPRWQDGGS